MFLRESIAANSHEGKFRFRLGQYISGLGLFRCVIGSGVGELLLLVEVMLSAKV
jgi:hypothetical protein